MPGLWARSLAGRCTRGNHTLVFLSLSFSSPSLSLKVNKIFKKRERRGIWTQRYTGEEASDDTGRDQSDAATSHRSPRTAGASICWKSDDTLSLDFYPPEWGGKKFVAFSHRLIQWGELRQTRSGSLPGLFMERVEVRFKYQPWAPGPGGIPAPTCSSAYSVPIGKHLEPAPQSTAFFT